ncbi:C-type lectin domain-containing protein [Rubripirellula sp.]|nr:C-type lectin domain-containing protein [Rubripirellula sp.]MDB4654256.1 C-type lectin domain-containing protein [Rubripirellula sp.]
MRYFIPCILLALTTCLYADEPKSKAIRKYENEVEVLRKQGQAAIKRLEGVFEKEVEKLRDKTLTDLQKELDAALESKDLDKAVALREAIKTFENAEASGLAAKAEPANKKKIKKRIPKNAVNFGGHRYALISEPMTSNVAAKHAESHGESLLKIDTAAEFSFVGNWWRPRFAGEGVWIGGSDEEREGVWIHTDGSPVKLSAMVLKEWRGGNEGRHLHWLFWQKDGRVVSGDTARHAFIIEWDN